jgi:hypothetical protein
LSCCMLLLAHVFEQEVKSATLWIFSTLFPSHVHRAVSSPTTAPSLTRFAPSALPAITATTLTRRRVPSANRGLSTRADDQPRHAPSVPLERTAVLGSRRNARIVQQARSTPPLEALLHQPARLALQGSSVHLKEDQHVPPVLLETTVVLASQNARPAPQGRSIPCRMRQPALYARQGRSTPRPGALHLSHVIRAKRATIVRLAPRPRPSALWAATARIVPGIQPLVLKTRTAPQPNRRPSRNAAPAPPANNPASDPSSVLSRAFPALSTSRPSAATPL